MAWPRRRRESARSRRSRGAGPPSRRPYMRSPWLWAWISWPCSQREAPPLAGHLDLEGSPARHLTLVEELELLELRIGAVGIVMEHDEALHPGPVAGVDRVFVGRMAEADLSLQVFLRGILRIVDQEVGSLAEALHLLVLLGRGHLALARG